MFKLVEETRAWWPVTWSGVTEDGTVVENRIEMLFRLLDADANLELEADARRLDVEMTERKSALALGTLPEGTEPASAIWARFLNRVAIDWRYLAAANGEPLPFGSEALARLMKVNGAFQGALVAYRDCVKGRAEARAGN